MIYYMLVLKILSSCVMIMMYRKDLGIDEINENWFGMYIINERGNIFCQVYGKTVEECEENADKILELNYIK